MDNQFAIGDRVLRKLTNTLHTVEDLSYNPQLQTMHPATGEFCEADSPWNYRIDGLPVWIVETALAPKPDDMVDPLTTSTKRTEEA